MSNSGELLSEDSYFDAGIELHNPADRVLTLSRK
jgi:hypothetical protein